MTPRHSHHDSTLLRAVEHAEDEEQPCQGCQCYRPTHYYAKGYYCAPCIATNAGLFGPEENESEV